MAETTGNGGTSGGSSGGGNQVENLVIGVNADGVDKGEQSLTRFGTATVRTVTSVNDLNKALENQDQWQTKARQNFDATVASLTAQWRAEQDVKKITDERIEQATRFTAKLDQMVQTFGMGQAELLRYQAAELGVLQDTEQLIAKLEKLTETERQQAIQEKRDIELFNERAAATARLAKIEQDRDIWLHEQRSKQYADYIDWWNKELAAQEANDKRMLAEMEKRVQREKEIQQERDVWMHNQKQKERQNYESWWNDTLRQQESNLEKQLALDIAYGEKSLKQKITTLQKIAAYQADPRTASAGIDLGAMFGTKALNDVSKLDAMVKEYNSTLNHHGKALGEAGAAMGVWDRALGNNRVRTEAIVLAHEALQGRFTRMPGSLMVMGEYLTAANVPIGAMAGTLLAVAAALGFVTYEMARGQNQTRELANAIQRTNEYSGETRDSLEQLAHSVGKVHGEYSEAYQAATALTNSGKFTKDQIDQITKSAVGLSYAFGTDVNTTIKEFESLVVRGTTQGANGLFQVTKAVEKLDEKYHFLTVTQMQTIIQMEHEGRARDASILAVKLYGEETEKQATRAEENIGWIQQAWHGVTAAIKGAIQAMADIGKKDSYQNREKTLLNQLQKNADGSLNLDETRMSRTNKLLLDQYYALQKEQDEDNRRAKERAEQEQKAATAKRLLAARAIEDVRLMRKEQDELNAALQKFDQDNKEIEAAQPGYMKDNEKYLSDRREAIIKAHTHKTQTIKDDGRRIDLLAELKHQDEMLAVQITGENGQLKQLKDSYVKGSLLQDDYYEQATKLRKQEIEQIEQTEKAKLAILEKYSPKDGKDGKRVAALRQQVKDEAELQIAGVKAAQALADQQNAEQIYNKIIDGIDKQARTEVKRIEELIAKQKEHNLTIGETKAQSEALRAQRELGIVEDLNGEAAAIEATFAHIDSLVALGEMRDVDGDKAKAIYEAELARINQLIAKRQEYAMLLSESSYLQQQADQQRKIDRDWERTNKKIEDDLASAIVDGGGKGWKKMLRDMETAFAKAVLQPILAPISAGITSLLYPTATQATGAAGVNAGGSAGSYITLANTAANVYKAASNGFAAIGNTMGQGVTWLGRQVGSTNMTNFGQGMQGFGADGSLGAMGQYGQYASNIAGSVGGYLAGSALNSMISGQYSTGSGVMTAEKIATAVASYINPVAGAIVGAISGLFNRAFGMGDKKVTGMGMSGTLADSGVSATNYTNWHQDGGWFRSDRNGTETSAVSQDILNSFSNALATMKSVTLGFGKDVGVVSNALDNYSKAFNIDFGKDGSKAKEAVESFITSIGDDLATKLIPKIGEFSRAGETAAQTLERLSATFKQTDSIAALLGKTGAQVFGSAGLESDAARERLLQLAGGPSNLNSYVGSYAQNFLTDEEKLAPVKEAVNKALSELGLSAVKTRDQFKQTISALNLTTEKDAQLFVSLMQLQDAFALVTPKVEELTDYTKELEEAKNALSDAYERESSAMQQVQDRMKSFVRTMKDLRDNALLGDKSPLTPEQKYMEARSQFEDIIKAANNGDEVAQGKFQQAFESFLEASRIVNASGDQYRKDFEYAMQASRAAEKYAQQQVDVSQASLDALKAQVSGLIDVNNSVKSVRDAIKDLEAATVKAGLPTDGVNGSSVNAIESLYATLLHRHSDPEGLKFWTQALNNGTSLQTITQDFINSSEYRNNTLASMQTPLASQSYPVQNSGGGAVAVAQLASKLDNVVTQLEGLRVDQQQQTGDIITSTVRSNEDSAETVATAIKFKNWKLESRVMPDE